MLDVNLNSFDIPEHVSVDIWVPGDGVIEVWDPSMLTLALYIYIYIYIYIPLFCFHIQNRDKVLYLEATDYGSTHRRARVYIAGCVKMFSNLNPKALQTMADELVKEVL